jgi:hypothetical protein
VVPSKPLIPDVPDSPEVPLVLDNPEEPEFLQSLKLIKQDLFFSNAV